MGTFPRDGEATILDHAVFAVEMLTNHHIVEAFVAGSAANRDGGCFARISGFREGDLNLNPGVRARVADEPRIRAGDRPRLHRLGHRDSPSPLGRPVAMPSFTWAARTSP